MSFVPSTCNPAPYGCGCKSPSPFSMPAKTAIEWALANPVLAAGACAYESDTGKWKLGNGTDKYMDLKYQSESGAPGRDGAAGPAGTNGINGQPGLPCSLTIGTVSVGTTASATITGSPPNQILNLVLPVAVSNGNTNTGATLRFVTQPQGDSVTDGDAVVFSAEAVQSAGELIAYKWQTLPANTSDQTKWSDVAAPPTSTLRLTADVTLNGNLYRCIASSGSLSVTSAAVMLSVAPQGAGFVVFDAQPFDCSVGSGSTAIFRTSVTIITGAVSARSRASWIWQGSAPVVGGGWSSSAWVDIAGSSGSQVGFTASAVLSFAANTNDSGRKYRCVVTAEVGTTTNYITNYLPKGTEYSNPATLTVT